MQKEGCVVVSLVHSMSCLWYVLAQRALYLMSKSIQAVIGTYLIYVI